MAGPERNKEFKITMKRKGIPRVLGIALAVCLLFGIMAPAAMADDSGVCGADGSVTVPEVLRKYIGVDVLKKDS